MPKKHAVSCLLQTSLPKNGLVLVPENENGRLGKFEVSQGGVRWTPKGKHSGIHLSWTRFAELMDSISE